jgi:hypothetical protein
MKPECPRRLVFVVVAALMLPGVGRTKAADPKPADAAATQTRGGKTLSLDELFAELDKNHDGKISKDEATGAYAQRFQQWDANGDGFATRQEIHDYRLRVGIDDSGQRIGKARRATPSADILKEPTDWRLETMSVPPSFAPDVKFKGSEEIRFAPGMFDTGSNTYFTCALAIVADGVTEMGAPEVKDFLERYYRGLSTSRARRSGATPDISAMQAVVNPVSGYDSKNRFTAQVVFFDSFSDGRKVTLNVEATVIPRPVKKQVCLILLVSPSAKDSDVWPTLRDIGSKAETNAP